MIICDTCIFYTYDEDDDYYYCSVNLDEDEMYNFIKHYHKGCISFHQGFFLHHKPLRYRQSY